ncbi:MAG: Nif3-like dinuclear metal center hexameric protein [Elusimicrobiota bacterium]|jgi:dinuclear metal center YbgI/SA1388 family protein|nr:Nif3-like dinuclear metal center hexameric protein [Elusimicrobiota bacterium]
MIERAKLISRLNAYLNTDNAPEQNGLQVEGRPRIGRIVFGVSASMALFEAAAKAGADMIITHHGLIWDKPQKITGLFGRRVSFLIKNNINLAAWHLPLDMHPAAGNNARLAKTLGLKNIKPFGDYHGLAIGVKGSLKPALDIKQIHQKLGGECLPFGPQKVSSAAIVSGGAHSMLEQAAQAGVGLYITGSRDEYVLEYAKEAKINFIAMGHYNSERAGVQALMKYVAAEFNVKVEFIDVPNPF